MSPAELARRRLRVQMIASQPFREPSEVVRRLGAVQAQDYLGALWAVGLRTAGATERTVEDALARRRIVRTWPMRGTLHFVAAEDVRWMLGLLTPRVVARAARRLRELELDEATFARSRKVLSRALRGRQLTRAATYQALERSRISTAGQRGIHILWRLAQEGLLCFGARAGKQHTFALLEEWVPRSRARSMKRDQALAEVALRYFTGHGPATLPDFAWWSGLAAQDARDALEMVERRLAREGPWYWGEERAAPPRLRGAWLLPAFDEYLVGYRDRSAVLEDAKLVNAGGGLLAPAVVVDGRVVGTWKRTLETRGVSIELRALGGREALALDAQALRYGAFLGRRASVDPRSRPA